MGRSVVCGVPDSYRQLEEMMKERGVAVDHATLNRWVIKYAPEVEKAFRAQPRLVKSRLKTGPTSGHRILSFQWSKFRREITIRA